MISEAVKKHKHVEKLIEEAEANGNITTMEVYEDITDDILFCNMPGDEDAEPIAEDIVRIIYKKR